MEAPRVGSKRKRTVLTLEKKLEVLRDKGLSQRLVGEKHGSLLDVSSLLSYGHI